MPTKCCWVINGSLTSERKASTSPSSFINHSILLLNRALKRQAPCLYIDMHFEVRAFRTRRRVGSARRRGNHMHDHSRFQRDINDVTGVSLSLSLSLSQKSLTHNIGSASALPIIQKTIVHVREVARGDKHRVMGHVRLRHSSHDFGRQSSQSVNLKLAGWQAKMASIEIWIAWNDACQPSKAQISPVSGKTTF